MSINDEILANPILRQVQAKFENQTAKGLAKYGETVNPDSYDTIGWLNHLQQELIDATVYVEVLLAKNDKLQELQALNEKHLAHINDLSEKVFELKKENEHLRKALKFYASELTYSKELAKLYNEKVEKHCGDSIDSWYDIGFADGIINTLNILNIKMKGINC